MIIELLNIHYDHLFDMRNKTPFAQVRHQGQEVRILILHK